ncbi:hypothetical protein BWP39_05190 [Paraburkholderia acidicola]|uniref:Uncharacterized protein n=1 Tax=Paraburkholderia acidicola TaxID=1912599 RepID=A0A2A4F682_9BURK|nr:hypothetical protein BWP39_05190 [Paraburkholderia acidicola]
MGNQATLIEAGKIRRINEARTKRGETYAQRSNAGETLRQEEGREGQHNNMYKRRNGRAKTRTLNQMGLRCG